MELPSMWAFIGGLLRSMPIREIGTNRCQKEIHTPCHETIPQRIWFDNLSAAVIHIEKQGKRKLTDGFQRFYAPYRFEAVFCNPYSGHEKGHVENKCGYAKRNRAVPIPIYESHKQLAATFAEQAIQDRKRQHYSKHKGIDKLWEVKQKQLLFCQKSL